MDAEEREIFYYLRSEPEKFVPVHAICRHAGGKHKFRETPDWAKPVLLRMTERGILDVDATGAYRLRPIPRPEASAQRWVSPQIAAVLRKSGKNFTGVVGLFEDDEAYYDSL